jgi:methyl-accepting chemotaxis protein
VVGYLDQVAAAISSAVEEQGADTREIATAAGRVAANTEQASAAMARAEAAMRATEAAAQPLRATAGDLDAGGAELGSALDATVRGLGAA